MFILFEIGILIRINVLIIFHELKPFFKIWLPLWNEKLISPELGLKKITLKDLLVMINLFNPKPYNTNDGGGGVGSSSSS